MKSEMPNEITEMLNEWSNGDDLAMESLMPLVYEELRRMANHYMQNKEVGHTFQPTVLTHEVYLKLIKQEKQTRENFSIITQVLNVIMALR